MKKLLTGVAVTALIASASAFAADNKSTTDGATNSGPGVQGPAGTRTGPALKAPGDAAGSASSGTSSGTAGTDDATNTGPGASTQPSQDSSGVTGAPGNKNGPAAKEPSGDATK